LKHWSDNLDLAKHRAQTLQKHLNMLLSRQSNELSEYLELGKLKQRFDLKKLPVWGNQIDSSEVNFEWPTHQDVELMSPDVGLKAI